MTEPLFDPVELLVEAYHPSVLATVTLQEPVLTRLEPQSVTGDPDPGAQARTADPLWMLGRQWQLGELTGEDAGSPVSVTVRSRALPVTGWAPGTGDGDHGGAEGTEDGVGGAWRPWPVGAVLDELVEDVPGAGYEAGLRWRAETGAQLTDLLREAGLEDVLAGVLAAHPLVLDPGADARLEPTAYRLHSVLAGRVPDGGSLRAELSAGEPGWVSGAADPDAARDVVAGWLAWVDGQPGSGGCWSTPRLEHGYRLRLGHGPDAVVVEATGASAGAARWHHYAWRPGERVSIDGDDDLDPAPVRTATMLATRLSFPGMPADRYWQLEDGAVDLGAIEAQPHDLARLCLAEFALVTGDDWLVLPVDGRVGALNQVLEVSVTTTFGDRLVVPEHPDDGFRIFAVDADDGRRLPGVLLPPVAHSPLTGDAAEEVAFLRDETANMAWAVETVVPGAGGDGRRRSAEQAPGDRAGTPATDVAPGDLRYRLMVPVPRHWIPLVPVSDGYARVALRKGAMLAEGEKVLAQGHLLAPTPLTFPAEEIPREGVTVRAVPRLARRADGSYARWVGHQVRVGRGEGRSGLAFDAAEAPSVP